MGIEARAMCVTGEQMLVTPGTQAEKNLQSWVGWGIAPQQASGLTVSTHKENTGLAENFY